MSVVINTNVDAIKIQNCLTSATNSLSESMERMSSGLKINSAKDDAAGAVISAKMEVQLSGNQIAQDNVQNASSLLSTAEGYIDTVSDNLSRIRDLTLQAKNGTYSEEEIQAMDDEVQERIDEINRICSSSQFSSLDLFTDESLQSEGATFQVGSNSGDDNTITASSDIFQSIEFSAITSLSSFSLMDLEDSDAFDEAIDALDDGIDNLTERKSQIGSAANRLDSALSNLTTQYENLSSANSLIVDADIAEEASAYTQAEILQEISTALLAQANSAPSIAASLIQV